MLACAEGVSNAEVVKRLGVSRPTVTKWRSRFVARRLEGLADEPRPGAARTITDEQVERVLVTTLETTPKDATHWSTRSPYRRAVAAMNCHMPLAPARDTATGLKPLSIIAVNARSSGRPLRRKTSRIIPRYRPARFIHRPTTSRRSPVNRSRKKRTWSFITSG